MPAPASAKAIATAVATQDRDKLVAKGGDLNASFKNHRALHALIQERPDAGARSTPARIACLQWMIEHGADPETVGGLTSSAGADCGGWAMPHA